MRAKTPKKHQSKPVPAEFRVLEETLGNANFRALLGIRKRYNAAWGWGQGAEFLYRELVRAYGLSQYESVLVALAKPKPGRKKDDRIVRLVVRLRQRHSLKVPQIKAFFETLGIHKSEEAFAAMLKSRRKPLLP